MIKANKHPLLYYVCKIDFQYKDKSLLNDSENLCCFRVWFQHQRSFVFYINIPNIMLALHILVSFFYALLTVHNGEESHKWIVEQKNSIKRSRCTTFLFNSLHTWATHQEFWSPIEHLILLITSSGVLVSVEDWVQLIFASG